MLTLKLFALNCLWHFIPKQNEFCKTEVSASINILIMSVYVNVSLANSFKSIMILLSKWNFVNWNKLLLMEYQFPKCGSNYFQQIKNGNEVCELNLEVSG